MVKLHLIGAYGMFWDRDEVGWRPGSGPAAGSCSVAFTPSGPRSESATSDGRRGSTSPSTTSGFSFDDVVDYGSLDSWSRIKRRDALRSISSAMVLRECEALQITALGTREQKKMRFQEAQRWKQLRREDFLPGGLGRRAEASGYTDRRLRDLAEAD